MIQKRKKPGFDEKGKDKKLLRTRGWRDSNKIRREFRT